MKLRDKVVVITGSGNGIGEAMARRFSTEGAHVVVTDDVFPPAAPLAARATGYDRWLNQMGSVSL
jgi:NAD(P)-dependent dehydrogenase (short-subunit alcohol dehydrogenase family)